MSLQGELRADSRTSELMALSEAHSARNYHPMRVVIARGRRRLGHRCRGPQVPGHARRLLGAQLRSSPSAPHRGRVAQLDRVTLVSRAFDHDQFGPFCDELAELAGMEMVLPMNSGAEAVETGIKTARKWAYEVKGVPAGSGGDHRVRRELPRQDHDDRQLLERRGRAGVLRSIHARVPARAVRGPGRAGRGYGGGGQRLRRRARRAHPG